MANTQSRSYAAAHFALELDGKDDVGLFKSIEGGSIKTDVMTYHNGGNYDRWRQLGKPKFEDVKLQVGMAMSKPFYKWIHGFFKMEVERKTGAIIAADFYYTERARRNFTEALIKEVTFPKLDGSDKSPAYMGVTLAVENLVFLKGNGKAIHPPQGFEKQKLWTSNNFRFKLDHFETESKRVTKIDSFTIKQNITEHHVGGFRAPIKCPSQVEFPNVAFCVPEADSQRFIDHFKKRGVDGEVPGRLTGSITTFDNQGTDLFEIKFFNADIATIQPDKLDASTEEIKQVKIELYTEQMEFHHLR